MSERSYERRSDPAFNEQIESLRKEIQGAHEALRKDFDSKHRQNDDRDEQRRKDIHRLNNSVDAVMLKQHEAELRMAKWFGIDGKEGELDKLSSKLSTVIDTQSETKGVLNGTKWTLRIAVAAIALLCTIAVALFAGLELRHHLAEDFILKQTGQFYNDAQNHSDVFNSQTFEQNQKPF